MKLKLLFQFFVVIIICFVLCLILFKSELLKNVKKEKISSEPVVLHEQMIVTDCITTNTIYERDILVSGTNSFIIHETRYHDINTFSNSYIGIGRWAETLEHYMLKNKKIN